VVVCQRLVQQFCSHFSWVGDTGWWLLTGGRCSEVVVNIGLMVVKSSNQPVLGFKNEAACW